VSSFYERDRAGTESLISEKKREREGGISLNSQSGIFVLQDSVNYLSPLLATN